MLWATSTTLRTIHNGPYLTTFLAHLIPFYLLSKVRNVQFRPLSTPVSASLGLFPLLSWQPDWLRVERGWERSGKRPNSTSMPQNRPLLAFFQSLGLICPSASCQKSCDLSKPIDYWLLITWLLGRGWNRPLMPLGLSPELMQFSKAHS